MCCYIRYSLLLATLALTLGYRSVRVLQVNYVVMLFSFLKLWEKAKSVKGASEQVTKSWPKPWLNASARVKSASELLGLRIAEDSK